MSTQEGEVNETGVEPIKEAQAIKTGVKGTQKLDGKESKTCQHCVQKH